MDAAALAAKRVGTTLKEKYLLEELLAVGGMAAVYRGRHRNGNRVAVKVLHASVCQQVDMRDRFSREGCVANKVDHHGAVRVLDDDATEDGSVFLVMELLEGETLQKRWDRAGHLLPYREVAEVGIRLLDVLAAAHNQGIVHRDIKPENLFLTHQGTLKVLDFGIARLRDLTGMGLASATGAGHMLGTPAYMPPEQVVGRSEDINGQTDLWATGATMFALISGKHVHEAESVAELLVYAGSKAARPLASVAPNVPHAIASVIDRALAFEKADRWLNAREMQAALRSALDEAETTHLELPQVPTVTEVLRWQPVKSLASVAPTSRSLPPPPSSTSTTGGVASLSLARAIGLPYWHRGGRSTTVAVAAVVAAVAAFFFGFRLYSEPHGRPAAATNLAARSTSAETLQTSEFARPTSPVSSQDPIPAVAAESLPIAHTAVSPSRTPPSASASSSAPHPSESADDHDDNPYLVGSRASATAHAGGRTAAAAKTSDENREVNPYLYRTGTSVGTATESDSSR